MKSELVIEENKYYKLVPGDILIFSAAYLHKKVLYYYINNTLMGQILIDKNFKNLIYTIIGNPTMFHVLLTAIKINDLKINNLLKSEDTTIVKMGITIIINEFLESINKYYENK